MKPEQTLSQEKTSLYLQRIIFVSLLIQIIGLTFSIAVSSIAFTIVFVSWIAKMIFEKKLDVSGTPFDYFFLAYIVAEVLSTIFAVHQWESFVNMKRLLLISIVYLVITGVRSERDVKVFLGSLIVVTSGLSIFEMAEFAAAHMGRLSVFQHYMTAGGIEMIVLLLALPFVLHKHTPLKVRICAAICAVPLFIALLLTFTRSSWLGFIGGAALIGILRSKYVLFVLMGFVVLFLLFAPLPLRERAYSIIDPNDPSNAPRIHMWKTGIQIFKDYPVLGVGDSDLGQIYRTYTTPIHPDEGGHLHNNFVHLLVTLGIVGLAAVMAIFIKMFVVELRIYQALKNDWLAGSVVLGALAVFVGFQINGLFEWNFGDQEIISLVWCTLGLTLAVNKIRSGDAVPMAQRQ